MKLRNKYHSAWVMLWAVVDVSMNHLFPHPNLGVCSRRATADKIWNIRNEKLRNLPHYIEIFRFEIIIHIVNNSFAFKERIRELQDRRATSASATGVRGLYRGNLYDPGFLV